MPRAGQFEAFQDRLSGVLLAELRARLEPRLVELNLPVFSTYPTTLDLLAPFETLGATTWTKEGIADFAAINPLDTLYVAGFEQTMGLSLDEAGLGCKASAVLTQEGSEDYDFSVELGPGFGTIAAGFSNTLPCGPHLLPDRYYKVTAARPFLYLLLDEGTGTVLALGRMIRPDGALRERGPAETVTGTVPIMAYTPREDGATSVHVGGADPAALSLDATQAPLASWADLATLVADHNRFALGLQRDLAGSSGNRIVSPLTAEFALGATHLGARGATAAALEQAAGWSLSAQALAPALATLRAALTFNSDRLLEISTWGQAGYPAGAAFLEDLQRFYGALPTPVDFVESLPEAESQVRAWLNGESSMATSTDTRAKELRHGLAETIAGPYLDTRLAYTATSQVDLDWSMPFAASGDGEFRNLDGRVVNVPLLELTGPLPVFIDEDLTAVEVPLADPAGQAYSLLMLIPEITAFESFEASLDPQRFNAIRAGLSNRFVRFALPEVHLDDSEWGLSSLMLGPAASVTEADFAAINPTDSLYVHHVDHRARLIWDAQGLDAVGAMLIDQRGAAVEHGSWCASSSTLINSFISVPHVEASEALALPISAQRPFLFFLLHRDTGTILFNGRLVNL